MAWRIAVAVLGIGLLLNGSLRMSDDVWPFGPLSQYAFSPPRDATIVITRVEGRLADGRRIDLPLRVGTAGISRAEIEARIPQITADPSLLRSVADGWTERHPDEPPLRPGVAGAGRDPPGRRPQGTDQAGRADHLGGAAMSAPRQSSDGSPRCCPRPGSPSCATVLYLFVIVDIHLIVAGPDPAQPPSRALPAAAARAAVLHLPPPSVPLTITLYVVILLIGCADRRRPTGCRGWPAGWSPPPSPGGRRSA